MIVILVAAALAADPGARCIECHPGIVERYRAHPMARTLAPIDEASARALAGLDFDDARSGYRFAVEGGALVERGNDLAGLPPHRLARTIEGFVGAGVRLRSLVLRDGERRLYAPVEWATGHGLVAAPHQEMTPASRLTFALGSDCLRCHTSGPIEPAFPTELASAAPLRPIDCDACHGDPAAHLADPKAGNLVNPAHLPRERQLDVCANCHLQGDARLDLPAGAPWRPGDDLLAHRAVFVARTPPVEFGFVSQSRRLALSACFRASDVTCTTCHDAHGDAGAATERSDRACAECHRQLPEEHPREGSCSACHLARGEPFDVRDVTITDHFIRRVPVLPAPPPPRGPLRSKESQDADLVRVRWSAGADGSDDVALAVALVHLGFEDRGLAAFRAIETRGPYPPSLVGWAELHFARGRCLERTEPRAAEAAYLAALQRDPGHAEAAINLGLLLVKRGAPEAEDFLRATAERFPKAEQPWRNLAALALSRRDAAAFEAALAEALARKPALPALWRELGRARLRRGDAAGALEALLEAAARDPDLDGIQRDVAAAQALKSGG